MKDDKTSTPNQQDLVVEMTQLRLKLLRDTPPLIAMLEQERLEGERELVKIRIRKKYGYLVPDFILRLFYSEFAVLSKV